MPETAGGAAQLADPAAPESIARAIVEAAQPQRRDRLIGLGLKRAAQFSWATTGAQTLDVYREVAENRRKRKR
jgi:glycosyltransferase involved in cell wall biosynthesis